MMKLSKTEKSKQIENNIVKDVRNIFRLKEEINDTAIKYIRKKYWSNNYIEYESNGDKSKTLSIEEYLNKIRLYLRHVINNLKKFDMWNIQLTIAINFI